MGAEERGVVHPMTQVPRGSWTCWTLSSFVSVGNRQLGEKVFMVIEERDMVHPRARVPMGDRTHWTS
jgi:hypothetical protein